MITRTVKLARLFERKYKFASSEVTIDSVNWDYELDYETEYYLIADVTGSLHGESFTVKLKKYMTGARQFYSTEELRKDFIYSDVEESSPKDFSKDDVKEVVMKISDADLEKGMHEANRAAKSVQSNWNQESSYFHSDE